MGVWISGANPAFAVLAARLKSSCHFTPIRFADFFPCRQIRMILDGGCQEFPTPKAGLTIRDPPGNVKPTRAFDPGKNDSGREYGPVAFRETKRKKFFPNGGAGK
jgi:hypothetical protein